MAKRHASLSEIRELGLQALMRELGPEGTVRFLQESEVGWGDYTAERHRWLGDPDLPSLAKEIEAAQTPRKR